MGLGGGTRELRTVAWWIYDIANVCFAVRRRSVWLRQPPLWVANEG